MPKYLGDVRCRVNSGKHLLSLSFSGFDSQNGHQPILRRALELTNICGQRMRYASLVDFREDATPRADRDTAAPMTTTVVRAAPALGPAAVLWLAATKASAPAYASG